MVATIGRRGLGAALLTAAVAGCVGAGGRERELVTATRGSPPKDRVRELDLQPGDRVLLEYRPSDDGSSRFLVEGPNGQVLQDDTLTEHANVRFEAEQAGIHTVRFEWGANARISLYVIS